MDRDKLDSILDKFKELEKKLINPEVISKKGKYRKIAKEYSDLKIIVKLYKRFKRKELERKKVKQMLKKEDDDKMVELAKDELSNLEENLKEIEHKIENELIKEDPYAARDAIVEIRAGAGGDEASLFASDLFRMYEKYATKKGYKVEVLNSNPTEAGGFKEIIFSVQGKKPYKYFKHESGVHRVQRVPETESSGRIHTSAASVVVLPEAEEVEVSIDPNNLRVDVFKSSGPGGQSVNTADSAVRITHIPTDTVVSCQDERSQHKNKEKAMRVLRTRLLDKVEKERRKKKSKKRKRYIGSGDRSEKIRTYNFPQGRVTDHRINFTSHQLENIIQGDLEELFKSLQEEEMKLKKKEI